MALVVKDRVQESSTTTGTGTLTLGGALTGFQTFSSSIGNGNTTYYTIQGNGEWEVGIGTVSAGALSRDTVLESSNGGSLVNFSVGTKNVFCTYPAEKSVDIETAQTLTNKTISGASNTLSNIGNSSLTNSAITINGTSTSLGGSINVGTVTSVTGTAPVVSSGGNTPAISMAAATTSVNGYLTSTDWNTFNGKYSVGGALGTPSSGTLTNCTGYTYANLSGTVPTWNQNTTGSAARAPEWQGSGSTSNWDTQFQNTEPQSATQIDLNSGTNCPTGGGWWFAESFRHSNATNFWGTQYAHGWEDRAYQRWVRNVSGGAFGSWQLDVGCRAWVNFNGTGTVAIRASGNVSSITDNGTGRYRINFSVAMLDTNYSIVGNYNGNYGSSNVYLYALAINSFLSGNMTESAPLTTSCEISTYSQAGSTDFKYVNVSIHR
jgi:hypothetical protein